MCSHSWNEPCLTFRAIIKNEVPCGTSFFLHDSKSESAHFHIVPSLHTLSRLSFMTHGENYRKEAKYEYQIPNQKP